MFDTDPSDLDPGLILTAAEDTTRSLNLLEARKLEIACAWADGAERLIHLGGDGTPAVAEFAPAEFGAVCGESAFRAKCLIGDALDLRHRHPVLWRRVLDGEVKAWVASRIVRTTREHSMDIALRVDTLVAPYADRKSGGELEKICEAHIIRLDPAGAKDRAERSESDQGVWVSPSTEHGTRDIFIRTTSAAAAFFDARIDRIANDLAICGNTDRKTSGVRRPSG
jgi:hypothetical protein